MIAGKGWDGDYVFTYERNRVRFPFRGKATLSDGEVVIVTGGAAPHKESSTGRVYVLYSDGSTASYFPGVVGARWRRVA